MLKNIEVQLCRLCCYYLFLPWKYISCAWSRNYTTVNKNYSVIFLCTVNDLRWCYWSVSGIQHIIAGSVCQVYKLPSTFPHSVCNNEIAVCDSWRLGVQMIRFHCCSSTCHKTPRQWRQRRSDVNAFGAADNTKLELRKRT